MVEGSKKGMIVKTTQRTILTDHHPDCHVFLRPFNFDVPTVVKNIVI